MKIEDLTLAEIKALLGDQAIFIAQLQKTLIKADMRIKELEKRLGGDIQS